MSWRAATLPYDPTLDGPIPSGGSVARQFPFVLPVGPDAVGNIQVTVTANAYHTAFERPGSLINVDLRTYFNGGDFPSAPANVMIGGVDFSLLPNGSSATSLGIVQLPAAGHSLDIPVNIAGATAVDTLINSAAGENVAPRREPSSSAARAAPM